MGPKPFISGVIMVIKFRYSEKACIVLKIVRFFQKGLFNYYPDCIVDGDFWVPNEIDS
jgi:hypothetical protein